MATGMEGLFADPAQIRQAQLQGLESQMEGRKGLSLLQQVAGGRGGQLAAATAGMFGLKTPEEVEATKTQQLLSSVDMSNPESIADGMAMAKEAGLTKVAAFLESKAYEATQKQRETTTFDQQQTLFKNSLADRTREINRQSVMDSRSAWTFEQQKLAAERDKQALTLGQGVMDSIGFNPQNPDMVGYYGAMVEAANKAGRTDLAEGYAKELMDFKEKSIKSLDESFGVISAKDVTPAGQLELTQMRTSIAGMPAGPEKSAAMTKMAQRQQYWAEEAARVSSERLAREEAAETDSRIRVENRDAAIKDVDAEELLVKDNLQYAADFQRKVIEPLENGEIFVGTGAEAKMELAKVAETLGIDNEEWKSKASNTEQAMMLLTQEVLATIKQLGANPSNADREYLSKTLPMISTSPKALKEMGEYIRLRALQAQETVQQKREYLNDPKNKRGTLSGFTSSATAELTQFLKDRGVKADLTENDSPVSFSSEAQKQFQSNSVVSKMAGVPIMAYPSQRITPTMVDQQFMEQSTDYAKGTVEDRMDTLMEKYEMYKDILVSSKGKTQEEKADIAERMKAILSQFSVYHKQRGQ